MASATAALKRPESKLEGRLDTVREEFRIQTFVSDSIESFHFFYRHSKIKILRNDENQRAKNNIHLKNTSKTFLAKDIMKIRQD